MPKFVLVIILAVFAMTQTANAQSKRRVRSADRAPAATAEAQPKPQVAPPERRAATFNWDAYLDIEGRMPNKDTLPDRGFTLNDAALYLSKDFGRGIKGLVELPFASDTTGVGNGVGFGAARSQAYLEVDRWAPVFVRAGQYNSYFGVEPNDSRDRFFADLGAIKSYVLPKTHTGLQVGHKAGDVSFSGQIADPNGTSTMTNSNPEFGANGRFENGPGYGQLGFSINDSKASTTSNKTNMIVDLLGGITDHKLHFDAEIDITKNAGTDKTGNAFGVFTTYGVDDLLSLGGRIEYLKDIFTTTFAGAAGSSYDSIWAFSFGPSYKLQPDITTRADFSYASYKATGIDETLWGLTVSVVASF